MKNYYFDNHKLMYHIERLNEYLYKGNCFPLYMEISPVGNCNHRCVFCAYDYIGHPNRKLKTDQLLKFIDEVSGCGLKSILYAGEGEPLLHPDIDKFITYSHSCGIDVGLYTNGQFLGEGLTRKILPALTFVRFSFNGGTRENYAEIHNVKPEIFDKTIKNIETAADLKRKNELEVDIGIQYVLLPENINFLLDAVKRFQEIGVDYFVVKPFVQQNPSQAYQMKEQFDLGVIEGILNEAEGYSNESYKVIARKLSFEKYGKRNYQHCYGTSFITVLNSAGDIATCLPYWDRQEFVFGNIEKSTFQEIWFGKERKKIKKYLEFELNTETCPPNCRPNAINEFLWEIKNPAVKHINFI